MALFGSKKGGKSYLNWLQSEEYKQKGKKKEIIMNKPNMFKVTYRVMEGNNYAGGWGKRTVYLKDLGDCGSYYDKIESVIPIYIEEFKPISCGEVHNAIMIKEEENREKEKTSKIKRLEKELKDLKGNPSIWSVEI